MFSTLLQRHAKGRFHLSSHSRKCFPRHRDMIQRDHVRALRISFRMSWAAFGNVGARTKDSLNARVIEELIILLRNNTATDDQNILRTCIFERLDQVAVPMSCDPPPEN